MKRYADLYNIIAEMNEHEAKDLLVKVFAKVYDIEIFGEKEAFNQIVELYKETLNK